MKIFRQFLVLLGVSIVVIFLCWGYTSLQLSNARKKGVYPSAEQAMLSRIDKGYKDPKSVKILYAGTNSFDGSEPHIWYVIAEVRAASRADGSSMEPKGCDAPGNFYVQTKDGWVFMPEGAFPVMIGKWMKLFGMAGPGDPKPSTNWAPDQSSKFCLPE